jgi:hypothetical protein
LRPNAWIPIAVPAVLFAILLACAVSPLAAAWSDSAAFAAVPFALFAAAFVFGPLFSQTRVSLMSLYLASAFFVCRLFFSVQERPDRALMAVFLVTLYAPALTVLFYHLTERGLFNIHGAVRVVLVVSCAAMTALLPLARPVTGHLQERWQALFGPATSWLPVALPGLIAVGMAAPLLLIKKKHESPMLGPILCLSLVFTLIAMSFPSPLWRTAGRSAAVLTLFMSGAAFTLALAVLESAWRSAYIDDLTQLPGRRQLKHHFARLEAGYAIAIVDMDRFKGINDTWGHDTGDQVLKFVASRLAANTIGKAYRYGGEEFVIVGEGRDFDSVVEAMETLRKSIARHEFVIRGPARPRVKPADPALLRSGAKTRTIAVTVSIGVARHSGRHGSPAEVLQAADRALYQAKEAGRNQTRAVR